MTPRNWVLADHSVQVSFSSEALATFCSHRQVRLWHRERGGLLFASSVGSHDGQVYVSHISGPHRRDRAGRHWVKLDRDRCIADCREQFDRGLHFVGYWHTHPESAPRLSGQDTDSFAALSDASGIDLQRVLLVVIGNDPTAVMLDVNILDRRTRRFERLMPPDGGSGTDAHEIAEQAR